MSVVAHALLLLVLLGVTALLFIAIPPASSGLRPKMPAWQMVASSQAFTPKGSRI